MADYQWTPAAVAEVFVLPAAVVDKALRLASPEQMQALLWFSRHHQRWDAAACAAELGGTPAMWESHLHFWVQQGLLQGTEAATAASVPAAPAKAARPAAVKPLLQEVLAYQETHRDFVLFAEEISARLGKPLSQGDVATLLYLITTAGVPQSSVILITEYAVSLEKRSLRYVEATALNWVDEGIIQPTEVDAHIRLLQEQRKSADKVQTILGLPKPLNSTQAAMAHRWLKEWGFSEDMLRRAQAETEAKAKKFNLSYMDKILEHWFAEGIHSPEQLDKPRPEKKRSVEATNPEESSLDMEGFEEQLLQYRPKYRKKEGGAPDGL